MKTHTIKPNGLSEDRWQEIVKQERGISYEDFVAQSGEKQSTKQSSFRVVGVR
jgi:hypothetical protein